MGMAERNMDVFTCFRVTLIIVFAWGPGWLAVALLARI